MDNARVSRLVVLLSLMLVAVLALAACGGGLETVPQSEVEAGQEGVGVVTDADADAAATVDADAAAAEVTSEDVATDTETVVVDAEAEAPQGSVTTTTETGTEVVTDTIVVTAVTELVTDTTIIEDVTASVAVTAEDADIEVDTSAIEADAAGTTVVTDTAVSDTATVTGSTGFVANAGVVNAGNVLVTASSLDGYSFNDINDENVGSVSSIILDPTTGRILYLVVAYGGFLTLGQNEVPVPVNAFTMVDDDTLVANFDQNLLEQFPATDDNWYETATWNDEAIGFWGGMNFGEASFGDTASGVTTFVRAEDIIGHQVALATEADDMSNTGNIEDLLLDLGRGYAKYLLVDVGDIEIDGMYAVPFSAFNFAQVGDVYAFNSNFDNTWLTGAPVMDRGYLTDPTVAPDWGVDNDTYWNERGFFGSWGD